MRHIMLAITIISLIVYSTTILGCKSTGSPTRSGSSQKVRSDKQGGGGATEAVGKSGIEKEAPGAEGSSGGGEGGGGGGEGGGGGD